THPSLDTELNLCTQRIFINAILLIERSHRNSEDAMPAFVSHSSPHPEMWRLYLLRNLLAFGTIILTVSTTPSGVMMQAGQIVAPHNAASISATEPTPGPDDVLIAVRAAGICGTDLHIFKGEYEARYPLIPGHEFSGVVAAVGANVTRFKVGDRVTADPNIPCNRCAACQRGEANQC